MARKVERIVFLYTAMPGAEIPAPEEGHHPWGDVEDTEQWLFCEAIVEMIDEAIDAARLTSR